MRRINRADGEGRTGSNRPWEAAERSLEGRPLADREQKVGAPATRTRGRRREVGKATEIRPAVVVVEGATGKPQLTCRASPGRTTLPQLSGGTAADPSGLLPADSAVLPAAPCTGNIISAFVAHVGALHTPGPQCSLNE